MKNKQAAAALRELMGVYNDLRAKWINQHGNDEGFNDWFTGWLKNQMGAK